MLRRNQKAAKSTRTLNSSDFGSKVQQKAYELYEKRGYSHGSDWSDWFEAERRVKKEIGLR